jgi:ferredoxin-NADP reductase
MLLPHLLIILAVGLALGVLAQLGLLGWELARNLSLARVRQRQEMELFAVRLQTAKRRQKQQETAGSWNGVRKFKIDRIQPECKGVNSFYLVPHDQKPLPAFHPGQFLTFELDIPGQSGRVVRCYSLSDRPRPDYYRVTIKRIPPPPDKPDGRPGLASSFFHERLKAGDIVDVKAPGGGFFLDVNRSTPVVLLAGGVGLTPMMSMLSEIVTNAPQREVWLFFSVRGREDHIMKEALETIAREHDNVRLRVIYSKAQESDVAGRDYHHVGRLNVALLKQELATNNFDFYMCGPGEMMSDLNRDLLAWGVPEKAIHAEAFGHASVKKPAAAAATATAAALNITFARSQKESVWTAQSDSLLDLALAEKVPVGYGCRAGNCGTCKTAVKSGTVKYLKDPGCEVETGSCLICICVPESNLVLEA